MIDINYPLQKKYKTALDTTGYPVYYMLAPDDQTAQVYIVFTIGQANQQDTKNSEDSEVIVQIKIHTWNNGANNGVAVATAAGLVYSAMATKFDLDADGLGNISQRRDTDVTLEYGTIGNRVYIDRIITYKHKIYIQ